MLFRRFALLFGLLVGALFSQAPEFAQQYRQRLGGAIDELSAEIAGFDAEAGSQSLDRMQAIARLTANPDRLAQQRGEALAADVERRDRLERQRTALASAGPLAMYAVLVADGDAPLARRTAADFQPALPATPAGVVAGGIGAVLGWMAMHLLAWPMRRRRRGTVPA